MDSQLPDNVEQNPFPQFDDTTETEYRDVENSLIGNVILYLAFAIGTWYTYAALVSSFGPQLVDVEMPRTQDDIKYEQAQLVYETELKTQLPFGYSYACPACGKPMAKTRADAHCYHCGHDVDLRKFIPKIINTKTMQIVDENATR